MGDDIKYTIMETPQINNVSFFDYDFNIRNTSLEGSKCKTPRKSFEITKLATPSFNFDEPLCIQDLNSLDKEGVVLVTKLTSTPISKTNFGSEEASKLKLHERSINDGPKKAKYLILNVINTCTTFLICFLIWARSTLTTGFSTLAEKFFSKKNSNIEDLQWEIFRMKQEVIEVRKSTNTNNEKIMEVIEGLKNELKNFKEQFPYKSIPVVATPPPPPPLPCILMTSSEPLTNCKPIDGSKSNLSNTSRPVISVDDILSVKLRKISDCPTRRMTEPEMPTILNKAKLKSRRQNSPKTANVSLSNSPCSSLTRLLNNHSNSNIRRLKRLQRSNALSFDECSKRLAENANRDREF